MNWYNKNIKVSEQSIHLWLDDERDPQDPYIQKNFNAHGNEIWVKTVEEAISYLKTNNVASISFDHDLGTTQTGYDLAKYIEEKAFNNELPMLWWEIHSQNPSGSQNIYNAMKKANEYWFRHHLNNNNRK